MIRDHRPPTMQDRHLNPPPLWSHRTRRVPLEPWRAVDRSAARWLMEHAAAILTLVLMHVHGVSLLIFFVEEFLLQVPVVRLGANRELEVFLGDEIPELQIMSAGCRCGEF